MSIYARAEWGNNATTELQPQQKRPLSRPYAEPHPPSKGYPYEIDEVQQAAIVQGYPVIDGELVSEADSRRKPSRQQPSTGVDQRHADRCRAEVDYYREDRLEHAQELARWLQRFGSFAAEASFVASLAERDPKGYGRRLGATLAGAKAWDSAMRTCDIERDALPDGRGYLVKDDLVWKPYGMVDPKIRGRLPQSLDVLGRDPWVAEVTVRPFVDVDGYQVEPIVDLVDVAVGPLFEAIGATDDATRTSPLAVLEDGVRNHDLMEMDTILVNIFKAALDHLSSTRRRIPLALGRLQTRHGSVPFLDADDVIAYRHEVAILAERTMRGHIDQLFSAWFDTHKGANSLPVYRLQEIKNEGQARAIAFLVAAMSWVTAIKRIAANPQPWRVPNGNGGWIYVGGAKQSQYDAWTNEQAEWMKNHPGRPLPGTSARSMSAWYD